MTMHLAQSAPDPDALAELSKLDWTDWLTAAGIVVGAIIVAQIVNLIVRRTVGRGHDSFAARVVGRLAAATIVALGIVYALNRVGVAIAPLLGVLGFAGLALAIAFQDILENFIAGILMVLRRPITVGDQIETSDYEGTVEDINLRSIALRTHDGVRIYIPNAMVWKNPIMNYTEFDTRRTTIEIGVGYSVDLDEAKRIMLDAVSSVDGVRPDPEPGAFVHSFGGSSIDFAVRFWHDPLIATEWHVRDAVARALKTHLDENGIEIPFPQRVIELRDSATVDSLSE